MRVPHNKDADANYKYPHPAQRRNGFSEKKITQQGDHCVRKRRSWLDIAVVRPSEDKHVSHKEGQQTGDPQPDITRRDDAGENMKNLARRPVLDGTNSLHALDRKSTRLNSSHVEISYAVFCL